MDAELPYGQVIHHFSVFKYYDVFKTKLKIFSVIGDNIKIHNNSVHHCPNSGIRVNKGDYVAIEKNVVYANTWWSSNAESAIVIADSRHIDEKDITKMFIVRNRVYGNRNKIPYYNANYEDPNYLEEHQMHVARPGYGTSEQTFIIDGSGNLNFVFAMLVSSFFNQMIFQVSM